MGEIATIQWGMLWSAGAPILIMVATALAVVLVDLLPLTNRQPLVLIALLGLVLAGWTSWGYVQGGVMPVTAALLHVDALAWFGMAMLAGIAILTTLTASPYLSDFELPEAELLALFLMAVSSMMLMMATTNLLTLFVGLEGMSLASYVMAAYRRRHVQSIEAGLKYFVLGSVASAFIVFGTAFCYGASGSLDMVEIGRMATMGGDAAWLYLLIGTSMLLVGFGFKISLFPFHFWAPDVYEGAPLPVTQFFATGVKLVVFVVLFRFCSSLLIVWGSKWEQVAMILGIATMTVGNLAALAQHNVKRMLAFSSVAHVGYAMVALILVPRMGAGALPSLMFYIGGYAVMTCGAFAVLSAMSRGGHERTDISDFSGLGMRHPLVSALFTLFLLSLAGIPPTLGFFTKYFLFSAAVKQGMVGLIVVAVVNSVVSVGYYVRPVVEMYFKMPVKGTTPAVMVDASVEVAMPVRLVLAITAIGVIVGGVFASYLIDMVSALVV